MSKNGVFFRYIAITRPKLIVWGVFLLPYIWIELTLLPTLPVFLREQVAIPLPQLNGAAHTPSLTLAYFGLTYLWSCIFVQSFGILTHSGKRKRKK